MRWPFELVQNALDAGPREGREAVTVIVRHDAGRAADRRLDDLDAFR
jgi:hypothetical protein